MNAAINAVAGKDPSVQQGMDAAMEGLRQAMIASQTPGPSHRGTAGVGWEVAERLEVLERLGKFASKKRSEMGEEARRKHAERFEQVWPEQHEKQHPQQQRAPAAVVQRGAPSGPGETPVTTGAVSPTTINLDDDTPPRGGGGAPAAAAAGTSGTEMEARFEALERRLQEESAARKEAEQAVSFREEAFFLEAERQRADEKARREADAVLARQESLAKEREWERAEEAKRMEVVAGAERAEGEALRKRALGEALAEGEKIKAEAVRQAKAITQKAVEDAAEQERERHEWQRQQQQHQQQQRRAPTESSSKTDHGIDAVESKLKKQQQDRKGRQDKELRERKAALLAARIDAGAGEKRRPSFDGRAGSVVTPPTPPQEPARGSPEPPPASVSEGLSTTMTTARAVHEDLIRVFKAMDKDKDGNINRREMVIALRKNEEARTLLGLPGHIRQNSPEHTAFELFFQAMDTNGDDSISWLEFESHLTLHVPSALPHHHLPHAEAGPRNAPLVHLASSVMSIDAASKSAKQSAVEMAMAQAQRQQAEWLEQQQQQQEAMIMAQQQAGEALAQQKAEIVAQSEALQALPLAAASSAPSSPTAAAAKPDTSLALNQLMKLPRDEQVAQIALLPEAAREATINAMFSPLLRMGFKAEVRKELELTQGKLGDELDESAHKAPSTTPATPVSPTNTRKQRQDAQLNRLLDSASPRAAEAEARLKETADAKAKAKRAEAARIEDEAFQTAKEEEKRVEQARLQAEREAKRRSNEDARIAVEIQAVIEAEQARTEARHAAEEAVKEAARQKIAQDAAEKAQMDKALEDLRREKTQLAEQARQAQEAIARASLIPKERGVVNHAADAAAKQKKAADAAVADVLKQQEAVAEATRQQAKIDTAVAQALSQHKSAELSLLRPSVSPNRFEISILEENQAAIIAGDAMQVVPVDMVGSQELDLVVETAIESNAALEHAVKQQAVATQAMKSAASALSRDDQMETEATDPESRAVRQQVKDAARQQLRASRDMNAAVAAARCVHSILSLI